MAKYVLTSSADPLVVAIRAQLAEHGYRPDGSSVLREVAGAGLDPVALWFLGFQDGGDRAGGTMRGRIVYGMTNDAGEILTWFGRDPEYEGKHDRWVASGKQGRQPEKFHFVKGFQRGLELFGQHEVAERARAGGLADVGLLVVEGPNDVIRMDTLEEAGVGLCGNTVSKEQAEKIAALAGQYAGNLVTLLLDNDQEGETGAKRAMWEIGKQGAAVQLGWWRTSDEEKYADSEPESLTTDQWREIRARIVQGAFLRRHEATTGE